MAALGLANPQFSHRCRRGRRHPRSAAVRMIGKRGASAIVAPFVFQCAEPRALRRPRLAAELLPRCVLGMAGASPRRRDTSVSTTVQLMNARRAPVGIASRAPWNLTEIKVITALPSLFALQATYECGMVA